MGNTHPANRVALSRAERQFLANHLVKLPCHSVGHTWTRSCVGAWKTLFVDVFKYGLKLYSPVFFVPALLARKSPYDMLTKTLPSTLRSSFFLGVFAGSFCFFHCAVRQGLGGFSFPTVSFLPGLLASVLSMLFETKRRRPELAVYCANHAADCLYNMGVSRNLLQRIPHSDTFLLTFSLTVLLFLHQHAPSALPQGASTLLNLLCGHRSPSTSTPSPDPKLPVIDKWLVALLMTRTPPHPSSPEHSPPSSPSPPEHKSVCPHDSPSCALHITRFALRASLIGCAVRLAISLFSFATKQKRKSVSTLISAIFTRDNARLPVALLLLTGTNKAVACAVRQWIARQPSATHRPRTSDTTSSSDRISSSRTMSSTSGCEGDDALGTVVGSAAGALGAALVLGTGDGQLHELTAYLLSKAVEGLYYKGIEDGLWGSFYYGDIALYASSCALLFHALFFEPHSLRRSYFSFLYDASHGNLCQVNFEALQHVGTGASRLSLGHLEPR